MADRHVEKTPRRNTRRLVVVVFGVWGRYLYQRGAKRRCRAIERQRRRRGCADSVATEPGLGLLVGRKRNLAHVGSAHADVIHTTEDERSRAIVRRELPEAGSCPCDLSAVIPPVEAHPGAPLPRLILEVSRLVELLVVVNAEGKPGSSRHCCTRSTDLRLEKARCHAGKDHERREAVDIWHAHAPRISRNLGVVPFNRKRDRGVAEHAEVITIVCVLRNPLARKDQVLPERLLDAGMEFISKAGTQRAAR